MHNITTKNQSTTPTLRPWNRKLNVLVIDDTPVCLLAIELLLSNNNCNVITVDGGALGLQYLDQNPESVDVILLDLMMPEISGSEVLLKIKADARLKNIPVILQSGAGDAEIEYGISLGADMWVRKPFYNQELLSCIEKVISLEATAQQE